MNDPKRILYTMTCLESLHNQHKNLVVTIGSLVKQLKSMPEGEHQNRLLDEISKLYVISGGIKEALDSIAIKASASDIAKVARPYMQQAWKEMGRFKARV